MSTRRFTVPLKNDSADDKLVILEPTADQVPLRPGEEVEVVYLLEPGREMDIAVEFIAGALLIYSMADYEVWQDGTRLR